MRTLQEKMSAIYADIDKQSAEEEAKRERTLSDGDIQEILTKLEKSQATREDIETFAMTKRLISDDISLQVAYFLDLLATNRPDDLAFALQKFKHKPPIRTGTVLKIIKLVAEGKMPKTTLSFIESYDGEASFKLFELYANKHITLREFDAESDKRKFKIDACNQDELINLLTNNKEVKDAFISLAGSRKVAFSVIEKITMLCLEGEFDESYFEPLAHEYAIYNTREAVAELFEQKIIKSFEANKISFAPAMWYYRATLINAEAENFGAEIVKVIIRDAKDESFIVKLVTDGEYPNAGVIKALAVGHGKGLNNKAWHNYIKAIIEADKAIDEAKAAIVECVVNRLLKPKFLDYMKFNRLAVGINHHGFTKFCSVVKTEKNSEGFISDKYVKSYLSHYMFLDRDEEKYLLDNMPERLTRDYFNFRYPKLQEMK